MSASGVASAGIGHACVGERGRNPHLDASVTQSVQSSSKLLDDCCSVPSWAVVFNWECCGGCGNGGFAEHDKSVDLMAEVVKRGSMVMVSDFSVKAVIADWRVNHTMEPRFTTSAIIHSEAVIDALV